jgi:hypothetical protein
MVLWGLLNRVESEMTILAASDAEILDDGRRGGSKIQVGSVQYAPVSHNKVVEKAYYKLDERMSLLFGLFW